MVSFDYTAETFTPKGGHRATGARADAEPEKPKADAPKGNKFKFESVADILANFNPAAEEWLVKKLFPSVGIGVLYGQSEAFKSFIGLDVGGHIANGWDWGGRKTKQGSVVYVAAEGAAGVRKRLVGFYQRHKDRGVSTSAPFHMTAVAPNLGTGQADLKELIAAIEAICPNPRFIVLDTIAQSLGGADENGAGMAQFVINATALANHFRCFVLALHHVGLSDDQRMRGWSGLRNGIDAELICERTDKEMKTTLTLRKLKDEDKNVSLCVSMERVVIGQDADGDDVTTLVVKSVEGATDEARPQAASKAQSDTSILCGAFRDAYTWLSDSVTPSRGFNGKSVRKVKADAIRDHMKERGFLNVDDKGNLTPTGRTRFHRTKTQLLAAKGGFVEQKGLIWKA